MEQQLQELQGYWEKIEHLDQTFHLFFVKAEEWEDFVSLGGVKLSSDGIGYTWAVRGGFPNGEEATVEEAKEACEKCLQTEFFDKGAIPWQSNLVSPN